MPSQLLATVYASAPTDRVLIQTLEIAVSGQPIVYVCNGFQDIEATLESSETVVFEAGNMTIQLPEVGDGGNQSLTFSVWNIGPRNQRLVEAALESGDPVSIVYREYLHDDLSAPAASPLPFVLASGSFQREVLSLEASYFDILNISWPRERYTSINAPGIKYL